jgi:hypothetical protein
MKVTHEGYVQYSPIDGFKFYSWTIDCEGKEATFEDMKNFILDYLKTKTPSMLFCDTGDTMGKSP